MRLWKDKEDYKNSIVVGIYINKVCIEKFWKVMS